MRGWLPVLALLASWLAPTAHAALPVPELNLSMDSSGVAHVHAVLELPADQAVVRRVLTDYPHWPTLFPGGLRVAAITLQPQGVQTDLYLTRRFLPGELHLVTLTRETAPGRLESSLVGGDFVRYHRIWILTTGAGTDETHAELEMELQPKTLWIPKWLFVVILKHELLEHFDKLRAAVQRTIRQ
jgi:hypothetical protein